MLSKYIFRFITIVAMSLTMLAAGASSAWSADIRTAKASGQIGEQRNGYLGIVSAASDDVQALVQEINQKRKAIYQRIASKNGSSLQTIEIMAGKKAIQKTQQGQFIRSSSGEWVKK